MQMIMQSNHRTFWCRTRNKIVTKGEPIVFSLTMPFTGETMIMPLLLRFLLNPEQGLKILYEAGQPVIEVEAFKEKIIYLKS